MQYRRISATSIGYLGLFCPSLRYTEVECITAPAACIVGGSNVDKLHCTIQSAPSTRWMPWMECDELICGAPSPGNADGGRGHKRILIRSKLTIHGRKFTEHELYGTHRNPWNSVEVTPAAPQHIVSAIIKADTLVIILHIILSTHQFIHVGQLGPYERTCTCKIA